MTSSQHGLYIWGYTHATMGRDNGSPNREASQSHKTVLSSDCRLRPACMKSELLVNARQL